MGCSLELIKCEHFIEKVVRHKLGTFILINDPKDALVVSE